MAASFVLGRFPSVVVGNTFGSLLTFEANIASGVDVVELHHLSPTSHRASIDSPKVSRRTQDIFSIFFQ
jgi:hypothetical protein